MSTLKFCTYDFAGKPRDYYVVDEIDVPKPNFEPAVSHHIVIIDRSGSMWSVMEQTKAMVEKVMVVEEFAGSGLLLTLISYSGHGDHTLHFARTPVADVLAAESAHLKAIREIRATCLTSVSGALEEALNHVQAAETTAVSIHTDGYFNDRSPGAEAKAVDAWVKKVQKDHPNVYANTIAYGSYTDFKMLDRISSNLSGKTVVAKDVKQLYTALHDTTALLAGRVMPSIKVVGEKDAFLAFHNLTQRRVNASTTDFAVKGVGADDATRLYRYRKLAPATWKKRKGTLVDGKTLNDLVPVYVLVRALLAAGRLNEAKFALVGTLDSSLLAKHYKALTAEALADFAVDVEARIAGDFNKYFPLPTPGLGFSGPSVLELCQLLGAHLSHFTLDLDTFLAGYTRRGVARIEGKWVDTTFVPADTRLVAQGPSDGVAVTAFEFNNASASINMQVCRRAELWRGDAKVERVAGKALALTEVRSYSVVGDGEVNATTLPIRISHKKLHEALVAANAIPNEPFDHAKVYAIPLTEMAAGPLDGDFKFPDASLFEELARLTVRRGLYAATLGAGGAKADEWTPEQLVELKEHNLTAALNYSPPTTNPYRDLNDAVSAGEIDTRTSYSITLGDPRMVSLKALYSANEYLLRRWTVTVPGADADEKDKTGALKKPKFRDLLRDGATFAPKTLSAKTTLTAIDSFMFPIVDEFLMTGRYRDDLADALVEVENAIEDIYAKQLRPLAFFLGSTGLVPENWTVDVLDAEALEARFPGIDIEKKQREGTFLVAGTTVIGVFSETAYYSTPKGVDVARALEGAA